MNDSQAVMGAVQQVTVGASPGTGWGIVKEHLSSTERYGRGADNRD